MSTTTTMNSTVAYGSPAVVELIKMLIPSCPDVPLRGLEAGNTHEEIFQEFLLRRIPFIGNEIRSTGMKMEGTVPVPPVPLLNFVITTYYL